MSLNANKNRLSVVQWDKSVLYKKQRLPTSASKIHPFLFATDFGAASLHALPYASSFDLHCGAKFVVLHVLPAAPIPETFHWSTTGDLTEMRKQAQLASQELLEQLIAPHVPAAMEVEFMVKFGVPSEQILQACHTLKADLLVLGLNAAKHAESASHLPWIAAHEIVSGATCPVMTFKESSNPTSSA